MKSLSVSVCIGTYNHERYIYDCVMSVLAQSRDFDVEIIVSDDASTDNTGSIVSELVEKNPGIVRYSRNKERLGAANNYRNLIGMARGDYVANLDGDDYWLPGKLMRQVDFLRKNPSIPAVYTNALCVNDDGLFVGVFNNKQPVLIDIEYLLLWGNFLNHSSMMYRVEFRDEINGWIDDFIDYRIHLYFARFGSIGYINEPCVVYRVGSVSSLILHHNENVRILYWDAVRQILGLTIKRRVLIGVSAAFLRSVLVDSIYRRSPKYFLMWWKVVANDFPGARVRILACLGYRLLVLAARSLKKTIFVKFGSEYFRIIYWR